MTVYYPRTLQKKLQSYLESFPVIGLMGPRQSGKSTLLINSLTTDYQYITFDDPQIIALFHDDPVHFFSTYHEKVIFDEVQKVPEIFPYLKLAVDKDRHNYGRFIVTGSSQFSLMKNLSESLAGRIGLLTLLPFQQAEVPEKYHKNMPYAGSYPELILQNFYNTQDWYASYINTYLEKDIRTLYNIGSLSDFQRLLQLLAANIGQTLNTSRFANDIGVSVSTIKRWLAVLEASFIVFLLPPFYQNLGKRLVKSPKIYFYETGLVAYLTGIKNEEHYEKGPLSGALFENYVINEIQKYHIHHRTGSQLYYFRTSNGKEIDLIVDHKSYRDWLEIKKSSTFHPRFLRHLKNTVTAKEDRGYLLYCGKHFPYDGRLSILPWEEYLNREVE